MRDDIEILRQPSDRMTHKCPLPEPHYRSDEGLIVRCTTCHKRWRATYRPPYQGQPGCMVWRRRHLPWPR